MKKMIPVVEWPRQGADLNPAEMLVKFCKDK